MHRSAERGFTLVEIMIVVAIIALLAAIAIPNVLRGRTSANESAGIGNLRALVSGLEMFRSVNSVYPDDWLADMYTTPDPDFGPPSFGPANGADATLTATVQGYVYEYAPAAGATPQTYVINSNPEVLGRTGTRSFWADETGQIFHCTGDSAAAAIPATAVTIDQQPVAC